MRKNYKIIFIIAFAFCFSILSKGQGFTISGTNLIDANGNNFIIKGFSIPTAWYVSQVNSNIANMRNTTNANCLRIVVQTSSADADWQTSVNNCIANDIIPIVELHDVTCGTTASGLQNMANWWASKASFLTQPNIAKYILINIANEWGDWNMAQNSPTTWRDAYISAVSTIRNAGINTTLIIDAPNCGQDIQTKTLKNYAPTVLSNDPKKNCLFSLHMYCEWSTSGGSNVTTLLPALKNAGIPVMVGEFGWEENNGSGGYCSIDAATIISTCQSNGIGWLAWSWSGNNSQESFLDMSSDWAGTSLTNWGNTVVNGSYGTKTAQTCSVFLPNLGTDIAFNKTVTVSSTESGSGNIASNLVDGSNTTRWSSAYTDNQQVVIDLQGTYSINAMMLNWEAAYASTYSIQVSTDSTNWTTVYSTTSGTGGIETHTNLSVTGRYVKLVLTTRATQWGFSLYEIGVYGTLLTCSASITASGDTTFCQGGNVVLNANSGTGYTYQWYNGASAISGQTSSSYTASSSGSYSVKVTNSSNCSATSTAKKVTVNATPTAPSVTSPVTYCQNATASALTATGTSLKWYTVPTGGTSSSGAPVPSTSATGTSSYYVSQTVNTCESSRSTITVTVNSLPSASITTNGPTTFCQGGSVTFNAVTGSGYTYQWYNGANTISGQTSSSYTATTSGSYSVKVINSSNCSATSQGQSVNVINPLQTPVISTGGSTTICSGDSIILTASGSDSAYQWYNNSNAITGEVSSKYIAKTSGSYSVIANGKCPSASSAQIMVNVTPLNVISVSISVTDSSTCTGSAVLFSAAAQGTGISYQWLNGGNPITGETNATYNYSSSSPVKDVISCQITSGSACTVGSPAISNTITETVSQAAPASVSVSSNEAKVTCSGATISFTASPQFGGANPVYQWQVNGQNVGGDSAVFSSSSLSNGDQVTCIMTSSLACATGSPATSAPVTVSITPIGTMPCTNPSTATINGPTSVTVGQTVTYSIANPDSGSTYVWSAPSGATIIGSSTGTSITINFGSSGGDITLTETTSTGAPFSTTTIVPVSVSSGATAVTGITSSQGISISPNPFADEATLYVASQVNTSLSVKIFDITGIQVYSSDAYTTNQNINLGESLTSGVYIVQAVYNSQIQTFRIAKSK